MEPLDPGRPYTMQPNSLIKGSESFSHFGSLYASTSTPSTSTEHPNSVAPEMYSCLNQFFHQGTTTWSQWCNPPALTSIHKTASSYYQPNMATISDNYGYNISSHLAHNTLEKADAATIIPTTICQGEIFA